MVAYKVRDISSSHATQDIILAKAKIGLAGPEIINQCMNIMGGMSYTEKLPIVTTFRDIQAASIMLPTSNLLFLWLGRSLLELNLLD